MLPLFTEIRNHFMFANFFVGFVEGLKESYQGDPFEYSLLLVKVSSAIGAAYLGALKANYKLPIKYEDNVDKLYHHTV